MNHTYDSYLCSHFELEALFLECSLECLWDFSVNTNTTNVIEEFDNSDLGTKSRPDWTKFKTNNTTTNNSQILWNFFEWKSTSGRNDGLSGIIYGFWFLWFRENKFYEKLILSFSSIWIAPPGNGVTSEPVAIRIYLVLISSVEPSGLVAITFFTVHSNYLISNQYFSDFAKTRDYP